MFSKECTRSASGTELFESGYGVTLDFVIVFYCHVYAPLLRLKPLLPQFLHQELGFFQDVFQFHFFHTGCIFVEFGIALSLPAFQIRF